MPFRAHSFVQAANAANASRAPWLVALLALVVASCASSPNESTAGDAVADEVSNAAVLGASPSTELAGPPVVTDSSSQGGVVEQVTTPTAAGGAPADSVSHSTAGPVNSSPDGHNSTAIEAGNGIPDAIHVTVPPRETVALPPVAIDEPVTLGTGIKVEIDAFDAIRAKAALPGEVGGDVLQLDLRFTNTSAQDLDASVIAVVVEFGNSVPATEITTDPARPLRGVLPAGEAVVGRYVFNVPPDARSDVHVYVSYATTATIATFAGDFSK